jgi:hypothetical protein
MELVEAVIARLRHGKHASAATNQHATIEELLQTVFSVWSTQRLYSKEQRRKLVSRRSESAVSSSRVGSEQWQLVVRHEESPFLAAAT